KFLSTKEGDVDRLNNDNVEDNRGDERNGEGNNLNE
ncbi:hypothetical protein PIIN_10366, partial [Serendipita indica DSM 11827]